MQQETRRLPQLPPWVTYVLLGMIIFSLMLHLLTWVAITRVRVLAKEQVVALAAQLGQAQQDTISTNIKIQQQVPIRASVPVNKRLSIPIDTSVSIDDTVDVPLAGFNVPVPIKATVPIKTTVPIEINETVDISTSVDLNMSVPIDLPIAGTSIAAYLHKLEANLRELAEKL